MHYSIRVNTFVPCALAIAMGLSVADPFANAAIILVPTDQPTIQAAIIAANPANNDIVEVEDGTYSGTGNVNILLNKAIVVRSQNGALQCTIDCQNGNNVRAFTVQGTSNNDPATIEGFRIINGLHDEGAGIYATSAVNINQCTIENCSASIGSNGRGGAIRITAGSCNVTECSLIENDADAAGGGLYCSSSGVTMVRSCIIAGNVSGIAGGGVVAIQCTINFVQCQVIENLVQGGNVRGGGLYLSDSIVKMVNAIIADNALDGTSGNGGAGIFVRETFEGEAELTLINCLIAGNGNPIESPVADPCEKGGGIYNESTTVTVSSCTIADNRSSAAGGGYYALLFHRLPEATFTNSILWGNLVETTVEQIYLDANNHQTTVAFCDVQGGLEDVGGNTGPFYLVWESSNIDSDPMFTNPSQYPYRLKYGSPCRNTGDTSALPDDEFDLDGDDHTDEDIPYDLDAPNARVNPAECNTDRGCFEQQQVACPGDCAGGDPDGPNNVIDVDDLLAVIINWGEGGGVGDVAPHPCGDNDINVDDLLSVINNWGDCEQQEMPPATIWECFDKCDALTGQEYLDCLQMCLEAFQEP